MFSLGSKALDRSIKYTIQCSLVMGELHMGVCDFHLQASSSPSSGPPARRASSADARKEYTQSRRVAGNATSQERLRESAQLEKSSSKDHNWHEEEGRWLSCLRDSPLFQHARYCTGLSRDRRTEGIVHAQTLSDYVPATSRMRRRLKCA